VSEQPRTDNNKSYGASIHDLIHGSPATNIYPSLDHGGSSNTPSPKRRRLHLNPPLQVSDPSSIVVADMQNESDALQILALASGHGHKGSGSTPGQSSTASLADFALVRLGILDTTQLLTLAEAFFLHHHHFFVSPLPGRRAGNRLANHSRWCPQTGFPRASYSLRRLQKAKRSFLLPRLSLLVNTIRG